MATPAPCHRVLRSDVPTPDAPRAPALRDPEAQRELVERGYVILRDLVSPEDVEHLRATFLRRTPPTERGMQVDFVRHDREFLRESTATIRSVADRHVAERFVDHRIVVGSYVTKWPGDDSAMALHEDRTFVDPDRYDGFNLWIALDDVGPEIPNGGLYVVPHSNRVTPRWVGAASPDVLRPFAEYFERHAELPALAAGSAVIYDNRTLHGSGPNRTDTVRVAAAMEIVPRSAELLHAFATTRRHHKVYRVDTDFLLSQHASEIRQETLDGFPVVRELEDDYRLTEADLLAVYPCDDPSVAVRTPRPPPPTPLLVREAGRLPWLHEDPPVSAAGLGPDARAAAGWQAVTDGSGMALLAVSDPGRGLTPAASLPAWGRYLEPYIDPGQPAAILVIDPGSSGVVRRTSADDPAAPWRFDVIDVAFQRGHLLVDGHTEPLEEDFTLVLRAPVASVWNVGPGVLVALLQGLVPDDTAGVHPAPIDGGVTSERGHEHMPAQRSAVAAWRRGVGVVRRLAAGGARALRRAR